MTTSNEMITFTLPENINDNVEINLQVVTINLCGLENGVSDTIIIPAEGTCTTNDIMLFYCYEFYII